MSTAPAPTTTSSAGGGRRASMRKCREIAIAVFLTALVCEGITSLLFYSYIEKESTIITTQREDLKKAKQENARLVSSFKSLNESVGGIFRDVSSIKGSVLEAKMTIEAYAPPGSALKHGLAVKERRVGEQAREQQVKELLSLIESLKAERDEMSKKISAGGSGKQPQLPPEAAKLPAESYSSQTAKLAAAASLAQAGGGERWLTIGIPTVPRPGDLDYLSRTLDSIRTQLPGSPRDPLYGKVLVIVLNNRPGEHKVFDREKAAIEGSAHAVHFRFVEKQIQQDDTSKNKEGDANVPGSKVRRQTRAVVALLREASGTASHFVFAEDDFMLCPHALRAMQYLISKVHAYMPGGFSGIRVSYGLCGIIVNGGDVDELANYLEQHQERRPPDHLLPEWTAVETKQARDYLVDRRNAGYRFNIFDHIGATSTLRSSKQVGWPGCYEELVFPTVFEGEAWKPALCSDDDVWPCDIRPSTWPRDWPLFHVAKKQGSQVTLMGPRDK